MSKEEFEESKKLLKSDNQS
ncbi:hypothetical protein ACW6QP_13185 [Salegentibacter sp. HM20]